MLNIISKVSQNISAMFLHKCEHYYSHSQSIPLCYISSYMFISIIHNFHKSYLNTNRIQNCFSNFFSLLVLDPDMSLKQLFLCVGVVGMGGGRPRVASGFGEYAVRKWYIKRCCKIGEKYIQYDNGHRWGRRKGDKIVIRC